MPRTCLACASPNRAFIDKALAVGAPLRDIAGQWGISRSALDRHKPHIALAITKAEERREVKAGDSVLDGITALQEKALDLLGKMETAGDFRGAIVAAKEARECLLAANELVARAGGSSEIVVTVRHIVGAQGGGQVSSS